MTAEKQSDAIREARNQYYRDYRAKNRDKIKEINSRYWAQRAAKAKEAKHDAETTPAE